MNASSTPTPGNLSRFAKLVVAATFLLILVGGHTTTTGAGMAFPDWPLSNGSLNPEGWLTNFFMFLEHSHRLTAGLVAGLVSVLFGWVLRRRAILPRGTVALALAAFIGVFAQAVLGGLRVVLDPQGVAATTTAIATTFRILHGCFAQIELCLLVALAAMLSPVWTQIAASPRLRGVRRLGWSTAGFVFLQLIAGATMRHLGAGLAIPTFPQMPDGGWMPRVHNAFIDLNFTHTRLGAVLVTLLVIALVLRAIGTADPRIVRPAALLLGLLAAQIALGMFVIWNVRPPILTTLHVVNGAALLATTVLLAVRASGGAKRASPSASQSKLAEARA